MNAESIATYISNLEKDNAALKKLLQQCEEEKAILEYESMLHYAQVSDDESVASYTEESDDDFEPDEYKPFSDSETDSESDSETDDDDDFKRPEQIKEKEAKEDDEIVENWTHDQLRNWYDRGKRKMKKHMRVDAIIAKILNFEAYFKEMMELNIAEMKRIKTHR